SWWCKPILWNRSGAPRGRAARRHHARAGDPRGARAARPRAAGSRGAARSVRAANHTPSRRGSDARARRGIAHAAAGTELARGVEVSLVLIRTDEESRKKETMNGSFMDSFFMAS